MATAKKSTASRAKKSTTSTKKTTDEKDTTPVEETTAKAEEKTSEIVVRMTRQNPVFEVSNPETGNKYRFTQAAPYALIKDEQDVNFLLRLSGMEIATPQQVADFYGR